MFTTFFESSDCLSLDFVGKGTAIFAYDKRRNSNLKV